MFVKNKASIDFKYRKSDYLVVLKANTVTYVDENKVSAKELRGCYGQRIDIISRDLVEDIATPHTVEEAIKKEAPKATKIIKKEELNDSFIEKVLEEIEGEVKKEETFPQIEERVLGLWDKDESFKKSLDSRPETEPYTFYDGPPFATGLPHYGHLLAGTIKDIVPRN